MPGPIASVNAEWIDQAVQKALDLAERYGEVLAERTWMKSCPCCKAFGRPVYYQSNGPTWWKGQLRTPGELGGYKITSRMYGPTCFEVCESCWAAGVHIALANALRDQIAYVGRTIIGDPSPYRRYYNVICVCGWQGHEGQLTPIPGCYTGRFHGTCPYCQAEPEFLTQTEGWTLVIHATGEIVRHIPPEEV